MSRQPRLSIEPALAPVAEPPPPAVERSAPAAVIKAPVMARRAAAEYAPVAAALHSWQMDQRSWPLLARLGRIHLPDRRAHRGRLRPAVERHRGGLRARSGWPRDEGAFATRDTRSGITLNWPVDGGGPLAGGIVGPAGLRPKPELCRLSRFLAFAAISTDWRGWPRCAATNSSGAPPAPQALSAATSFRQVPRRMRRMKILPPNDVAAHDIAMPELPVLKNCTLKICPPKSCFKKPCTERTLPPGRFTSGKRLTAEAPPIADVPGDPGAVTPPARSPEPTASETSHPTDLETHVETPVGNAQRGNAEERFAVPPDPETPNRRR